MSSPAPQAAPPSPPPQAVPLSLPNYDVRTWASRAQWHILEQNIANYEDHRGRRKTVKLWPTLRGACEAVSTDSGYTEGDRSAPGGKKPIVPTNTQLKNWYRNRGRKRVRKEGQKLLSAIMANVVPARTRAPKVVESYQKLYKEKISATVDKRMDELEAAGTSKESHRAKFLEINNAVRDALFETEDDDIKKQVEAHRAKEIAEGSGRKLFSKGGTFGHVVNCVERILVEFLSILHVETGLIFSTAYAGVTTPTSMQTGWVHIGRNADGKTIRDFDKAAVLDFTAKYTQFVRKAIPQNKREQLMGLWEARMWDLSELGLISHDIDVPDEEDDDEETSDHQPSVSSRPSGSTHPSGAIRKKRKARKAVTPGAAVKIVDRPAPVATTSTTISPARANPPSSRAQEAAAQNTIGPPPVVTPSTAISSTHANSSRADSSVPSNTSRRLSVSTLDPELRDQSDTYGGSEISSPTTFTPSVSEFGDDPMDYEVPSPSFSAPDPSHLSLSAAHPRSTSPLAPVGTGISVTHGSPRNTEEHISANERPLVRQDGPSEPMPMTREVVLAASDVVLDQCKTDSNFSISLTTLRALPAEDDTDRWRALCPPLISDAISRWIMDPNRRNPVWANHGNYHEFVPAWRGWWRAVSALESVDSVTLRWLLVSLAWWGFPDGSVSPEWFQSSSEIRTYVMRGQPSSSSSPSATAPSHSDDADISTSSPPEASSSTRKRSSTHNPGPSAAAKRSRVGRKGPDRHKAPMRKAKKRVSLPSEDDSTTGRGKRVKIPSRRRLGLD